MYSFKRNSVDVANGYIRVKTKKAIVLFCRNVVQVLIPSIF